MAKDQMPAITPERLEEIRRVHDHDDELVQHLDYRQGRIITTHEHRAELLQALTSSTVVDDEADFLGVMKAAAAIPSDGTVSNPRLHARKDDPAEDWARYHHQRATSPPVSAPTSNPTAQQKEQ